MGHKQHIHRHTGEPLGQRDLGAAQRATAKGRNLRNAECSCIAVSSQHPLLLDVDRWLEVGAHFCRPRKRRLARDGVNGRLRQPGWNCEAARGHETGRALAGKHANSPRESRWNRDDRFTVFALTSNKHTHTTSWPGPPPKEEEGEEESV